MPNEGFVSCKETHPETGDVCSLDVAHVQHSDPAVKQHQAKNGHVRWPKIRLTDEAEGYNNYVTFRL